VTRVQPGLDPDAHAAAQVATQAAQVKTDARLRALEAID
jgi:hypothetical protein